MTPAVGATFEAIKRGELSHDADAAFTAHVLNAIPKMNETGFTLSKGKSRGKIDAAVALCIAYHRANSKPESGAPAELWASFG
jgi:phage terminase large subunit-like protein